MNFYFIAIETAEGGRETYDYDCAEEGLLYDTLMLYDLNGNRTGKIGSRLDIGGKKAEMAVSYRYDPMNRLLREQYSGGSVDLAEGYRYNERNELTERVKAGKSGQSLMGKVCP